jgi:hypothetical protein
MARTATPHTTMMTVMASSSEEMKYSADATRPARAPHAIGEPRWTTTHRSTSKSRIGKSRLAVKSRWFQPSAIMNGEKP